jgi:predicted metal-binding protein
LNRIESFVFYCSSLESIEIPRNVQFIDGSAFRETRCNHISIEANHQRFMMQNDFLVDFVDHRLIRTCSASSNIEISSDIEIFGSSCFSDCKSLLSISFESNSRLTRIESSAFSKSSLQSIEIPRNVEIVGSSCFSFCKSLSSISFESNSRLTRSESSAFSSSSLESIEIPRNVEILGSSCFSDCKSISSISFESNSRLLRIESSAFSYSSLKSIEIQRNVEIV